MSRLVTLATLVVGVVGCQLLSHPECSPRPREDCHGEGNCRPCERPEGAEREEAPAPAPARSRPIHVHAPAPEIVIETAAPVIRQAPAPSVSVTLPGPATGGPTYGLATGQPMGASSVSTAAPAVQVLRERVTLGLGSISLPFPRVFRQLEELPPAAPAEQLVIRSNPGVSFAPAPAPFALVAMPPAQAIAPQIAAPAPAPFALVAMPPAQAIAPQIAAPAPAPAPAPALAAGAPVGAGAVPCVTRTEMVCHPVQTTVCGPGVTGQPPLMPPAGQ